MSPVVSSLLAWAVAPVVLYALGLGLGLLVERLTSLRLPNALLPALGVGLCISLATAGFLLGANAAVVAPVVVLAAIAGYVLAGRGLRERLDPGVPGLAGLATFVLYIAPVLLADHLMHHGDELRPPGHSNAWGTITGYLSAAYPLGAHGPLALLGALVRAPLEALYQPYHAVLAATAAMSLTVLARRAGLAPLVAAVAAFFALAANLTFQYALQGSVKEIAMVFALSLAAAIARELLDTDRPVRAALAIAVPLAAAVNVYSLAAGPYVVVFGASVLIAMFLQRSSALGRRVLPAAVIGAAVILLASAPTLAEQQTFRARTGFGYVQGGEELDLGHLARPLTAVQALGIWIYPDYRVEVPGLRGAATWVLLGVAGVMFLVGLVATLRRREGGLLLVLTAPIVAYLAYSPRLTPYVDAKMLAILSPGVVLAAAFGIAALTQLLRGPAGAARRRAAGVAVRLAGPALACVLGAGILLSDVFAYHRAPVPPLDRMRSLEDLDRRYAEERGLLLLNEFEEFAKYFMRDTRATITTEKNAARRIALAVKSEWPNHWFDLDDQQLASIERYPVLAIRRGPVSRPPANFRLEYSNAHYEVWRRSARPRVREHLRAGEATFGTSASGVPSCRRILSLASRARPGDRLVAAVRAPAPRLEVARARRPPAWVPNPDRFGQKTFIPEGTGGVSGSADFAGGRYRVWVRGSSGRAVEVRLDGRRTADVLGVNTPGQWLGGGEVAVSPGRHLIEVRRGGAAPRTSDGFVGHLGPVVFEPVPSGRRTDSYVPADAARLCGRSIDWLELVRP